MSGFKRYWPGLAVGAIFLAQFGLGYYGQWHYHYPVAPGDDIYNHLNLIAGLQAHPTVFGAGVYPPGFHYFVIGLSHLFGRSPLVILTWLWPALLLASGLAILLLTWQLFGLRAGILAYLLYALLSLQPLQTATDGTLVNLFAGDILLPLTLLSWAKAWSVGGRKKWLWIAWTVLGVLAVAYSHHLSTLILFGVLTVSGAFLVIDATWKKTDRLDLTIGSGLAYLALAGGVALVFWLSPFSGPVKDLVATAAAIARDNKSWPLTAYLNRISFLIGLTSLAGIVYYLWLTLSGRADKGQRVALIVILSWAILFLIGSRTSLVGEPERLGRDFALPAAVIAGLALSQWRLDQFGAAKYLILAGLLVVGGRDALIKTDQLLAYDKMVRFSQADAQLLAMIDTGQLPEPAYIWVRNPAWEYLALPEIETNQIQLLSLDRTADLLGQPEAKCVWVSLYQPGTWPPDLQDDAPIVRLEKIAGVQRSFVLEDQTKIWYSLCKS